MELLPLLLASALALLHASSSALAADAPAQFPDCSSSLVTFMPCLDFLQTHTPLASPTCCAGLQQVLDTQPACLCAALQASTSVSALNQTRVQQMPAACGLLASTCTTSGSPGSSPPAPGTSNSTAAPPGVAPVRTPTSSPGNAPWTAPTLAPSSTSPNSSPSFVPSTAPTLTRSSTSPISTPPAYPSSSPSASLPADSGAPSDNSDVRTPALGAPISGPAASPEGTPPADSSAAGVSASDSLCMIVAVAIAAGYMLRFQMF